MHQLEIKVLDIVGARCNHEVPTTCFGTSVPSSVKTVPVLEKQFPVISCYLQGYSFYIIFVVDSNCKFLQGLYKL